MKHRTHARIGTARQLEILLAVYEHKSLSEAAKILFLTQPTVSMQLSKLAENIGLPLYYINAKRLVFTEVGERVVAHARQILREYDYLALTLEQLKGTQVGAVSLGLVTTAKYFIPHLIGPYAQEHPDVELSLKIGNRAEIIQRVMSDEDDFYVFSNPPGDQGLELIPFLSNKLWPVVCPSHPLAQAGKISIDRFLQEPFLSREAGSGTRHAIEQFLSNRGMSFTPRMIIESNEAIRHAVMSNLGVSVVSEHTLNYGGKEGLTVLDVDGFPIESKWYLVRRSVRPLSPAAQALADCLTRRQDGFASVG
ncbi:MAG: LysR substrate-binding domain-containing protein [Halieaceae bacterium]|nr:LysR substrate-binding domain-containing protein [Halieaceae bacterium]